MDGPTCKRKGKRTFVDLPFDVQRAIIDRCVSNESTVMRYDGETFELPEVIQFTYVCSNGKCKAVLTSRFFRTAVINGGVNRKRECPHCRSSCFVKHKTAELVLPIHSSAEKEELIGIRKFLAQVLEDERELYGGEYTELEPNDH